MKREKPSYKQRPQLEMAPTEIAITVVGIFCIALFLALIIFHAKTAHAAYETVKITSKSTRLENQCPAGISLPSGVGPCKKAPEYKIWYKRQNGTTGEVITKAYPIGWTLVVNFCPGKLNEPDHPCQEVQ